MSSRDARLRDASPNRDTVFPLREAGILVERRRAHHDTVRPHRALGCRPPAPEVIVPVCRGPVTH